MGRPRKPDAGSRNPLIHAGYEFPHAADVAVFRLRSDVSLLLEKGHTAARRYPASFAMLEADICRKRENGQYKTLASLVYAAGATIMAGGDTLAKTLKELDSGE